MNYATFIISFIFVGQICAYDVIPVQLTSENWNKILEGEWMIKFYAPWCPACRQMEDEFKSFGEFANTLGVHVAEVDITQQSGLSGRFLITALPTIYHAREGEFRRYSGKRSADHFQDYIEKKLWKDTDPVSSYRHPSSILMHMMSALFQMSMWMKDFMDLLTDSYGFSTLAAYTIFGIAIIATGLSLGLILVLIIDCINPPKRRKVPSQSAAAAENEKQRADAKPSTAALEADEDVIEAKDHSSEDENAEVTQSQRSSKSSSQSSSFEKILTAEVEEGGDAGTSVRQRKNKAKQEE